ncbi:guanine deaminase-like isoform X1 [Stylophora pistillata]|uniref:guanine deaminase-like isoform X1 n=1 Tax=Stylophora pistillata TaxID=50429 RepID=UPI000C03E23A|nr:guanine deaminase-like isoform X1 [Stylophora pistillata]
MAEPNCKTLRSSIRHVFSGTLVHSTAANRMEMCQRRIIGINQDGKIVFVDDASCVGELAKKFEFNERDVITLKDNRQFMIPGLVDTHIHAPQYIFTGTGYDLPLLQWLEKYTFPSESRFRSKEFAQNAYRKVVTRLLKNGTTTASYFATIHYDATVVLCDVIAELGQRAYVGKVCMDRNSPNYYIEGTDDSIKNTDRIITHILGMKNPLITPVITPRFVVSCTSDLMKKLGNLAKEYDLPIQSHLNENKEEISMVKDEFPNESYTAVYDKHNLLNGKTYMAHCCYSTEEELNLMLERNSAIAHCPTSNFNIRSGVADIKHCLNKKIKVGLGTDVSGGESPSMLVAIRDCVKASNVISFGKSKGFTALTYEEAFFLATLGGSQVLGLDNKTGNFEVGKDFDALFIDVEVPDSPFDCFNSDDTKDVVQKFLYLGDDRNIRKVYVAGKLVAGRDFNIQSEVECIEIED